MKRGRDHADWARDPDFLDNTARVRNRDRLVQQIESVTSGRTRQEWLAELDAAGIPCGPINNYGETFADPQVRAREMVLTIDHPTLGVIQALGSPIKMSATPPNAARRAPLLGEHTEEVLREAGVSEEDIASAMSEAGRPFPA